MNVTAPFTASWLAAATLSHAALMICGFLGTVIGIERAVAVHRPDAFVAPVACAAGAILLLAGAPWAGAWLLLAGSVAFAAVNVLVVHRQRASHTVLLLVGALAWCIGNVLYVANRGPAAVLPWWFAFLVLTIAAERLAVIAAVTLPITALSSILGMNVIVSEELYDRQYIQAHTDGFEKLRNHLAKFVPETMAPVCGIAPDVNREKLNRTPIAVAVKSVRIGIPHIVAHPERLLAGDIATVQVRRWRRNAVIRIGSVASRRRQRVRRRTRQESK